MFLREQAEKINLNSVAVSGLLASILLLISLLLWFCLKEFSLILIAPLLLFLVSFVQLESYYRNQQLILQQTQTLSDLSDLNLSLEHQYQQVEALFSIFNLLKLRAPLPPMRGWAVSPDFTRLIIASVQEYKPKLVVELGSGVSTLVSGYCLQELGQGSVVSLDHDEAYAGVSKTHVLNHALQDVAKIVYAPLQKVSLGDTTWLWYSTDFLQDLEQPIDLLVIDGPPGGLQPRSRYPALPLLYKALSDDAIILLDDSDREDEQGIIQLWKQEFPLVELETAPTEKGACVLRVRK